MPKSIMAQRDGSLPEFPKLPSLHGSEVPATPFPAPAACSGLAGLHSYEAGSPQTHTSDLSQSPLDVPSVKVA